jgi:hypothetical protein
MEKKYLSCHSCGMPFTNDQEGDDCTICGTAGSLCCSYCCENVAAARAEMTTTDLQEFVKKLCLLELM